MELDQAQPFHPLCMLWGALVLVISAMLVYNLYGFIFIVCAFILLLYASKTSVKHALLPFRKWWWLLLITFVIHAVLSYRNTGLSNLGGIANAPDFRGVSMAFFFAVRMGLMLSVVALLFRVHPPQFYGQAVGRVFSKMPFGRARWSQLELTGTLAMRFIPFLQDETVRLKMAYLSRGIVPVKSWWKQLISLERLLFPLMISALRRADNVALALEARGFNPQTRRTYYFDWSFQPKAIVHVIVITIFCLVAPLV